MLSSISDMVKSIYHSKHYNIDNSSEHSWHIDSLTINKRWSHIQECRHPADYFSSNINNPEKYYEYVEKMTTAIKNDFTCNDVDRKNDIFSHSDRFINNTICLMDLIRYSPDLLDWTEEILGKFFLTRSDFGYDSKIPSNIENTIKLLVDSLEKYFVDDYGVISRAKYKAMKNNYKVIDVFDKNGYRIENQLIIPDDRGDIIIQFNRFNYSPIN